ncbi:MAG: hypothetical protein S4CHLAM20_05020 [Chlamydiia bacterium]|nr:hypothetical protein [Chlamydiia bacterium]
MKIGFDVEEYRRFLELYIQLKEGYQGDWFYSSPNDNFQMMAKEELPGNYYLIIRGTQFDKALDNLVGLEVFRQLDIPFEVKTNSLPKVSYGAITEFSFLIAGLFPYLETLEPNTNIILGGHSQGGGMTSLILLWIQTIFPRKFNLKTYASAPPTIGNTAFKDLVLKVAEYGFYRIENPNDVVPHMYANLKQVIQEGIPITLPFIVKLFFGTINTILKLLCRDYQNIGDTHMLLTSNIDLNTEASIDSLTAYKLAQEAQHDPNNYLYLLNKQYPIN